MELDLLGVTEVLSMGLKLLGVTGVFIEVEVAGIYWTLFFGVGVAGSYRSLSF